MEWQTMRKEGDMSMAEKGTCVSLVGTQPQVTNFLHTVTSDRRLCCLCIVDGENCRRCRMEEVLENVILSALYQTQSVVVPREMVHSTLDALSQRVGEDSDG
jgi:hypothetical protein